MIFRFHPDSSSVALGGADTVNEYSPVYLRSFNSSMSLNADGFGSTIVLPRNDFVSRSPEEGLNGDRYSHRQQVTTASPTLVIETPCRTPTPLSRKPCGGSL